ncbi:MAG TPA: hypothetical protein VLB74_04665, partial [Flavobacterium sp.]|uniref:hypothetical protein n=1 Tax=Flavobacterium sp. TaxID=239 RepID=UPI002B68225D
ITTEFFPEGNVFLEGTSNTIAIKITDCNGNGIAIKDGEIINPQGVTITNFSTNELGYGKFEIIQTKNELYKAVFTIYDTKTEKNLPLPEAKGITFSTNNYTFENKTTLKVKTNANSLAEYKNEPLKFVIQQDDYNSYVPFSFKENSTEQLLALPNENFMNGINAIYLIDKNNKKIAERIIYKPLKFDRNIDLKVLRKQNDSIVLSGTSTVLMGTLSISVLPNETKSLTGNKTMYNSFLLDNQLNGKSADGNILLSNFSKRKHYELDTYLMCQKSKYNWQTMLTTSPKEKFEFDNGLTIKGTLNVPPKDRESRVNMSSITSGLNVFSTLNDKNEFYFKNILVSDSTLVHYSLLDKKGNYTEIKLATQILNNNRTFIKPFKNYLKECPSVAMENRTANYTFPKIANTLQLDSITIETKTKGPKLVNVNRFSNNMSKGFKISDKDSSRDLLQFIAANGYDVTQSGANVIIVGRRSTSFYGSKSPLIYIDDSPIDDFSLLLNYSLRYIDEIYINKNGFGGGMGASNGVIRIYTKKTMGGPSKSRINSQSVVIRDGFEKTKQFVNPKYTSFTNEGFLDFGTIHWEPYVETDENGIFKFAIPNYYVKSVKVVIEGISSDGQIISETKIIEIP